MGRPDIAETIIILFDGAAFNRAALALQRGITVEITVQHVHLKTRDVQHTVQYYVDNFGATMKREIPGRGYELDLHGVQLNITGIITSQNHEQHYGIEHLAVETGDYPATLDRLRRNGVQILEEIPPANGRRVCFVQAPDGAQMEIIEKS